MLSLKVISAEGKTICVSNGEEEVGLVCSSEYKEGDRVVLELSKRNVFLMLQVDDALGQAFIYAAGNIEYKIPFGERRSSYSPKAFAGGRHYLYARLARDYEIASYRNLALNVCDQHGETNCYPHASANVETRGEAVFAARNAIDGVKENRSHGEWPYESWGINRQEDAVMKLDFGRKVLINKIVLYTRADFPHDNWWRQVTIAYSDGTWQEHPLEKSALPHIIPIDEREVNWLELRNLVKSEEPSPFPALTQIEVYGRDLKDH